MPISNSIRLTLNLKDPNIIFKENCVSKERIGSKEVLIYAGYLNIKTPNHCQKCGVVNDKYTIIRNGTKTVSIKLPRVSNQSTILRLKKPRFYCKACTRTFIAGTSCVKAKCQISNNTYHNVLLNCKTKQSIKDIAQHCDLSTTTIQAWLSQFMSQIKINRNDLPKHLSFDEFRSVKEVSGKMSFVFIDASNGKVINILQNRSLTYLRGYFFSYPKAVRDKVKSVTIDMYEPYIQLIRSCFPKARIITDRFHIIQHLNRALNSKRIEVMKNHPTYQAKLKRYWRLFLKNSKDINYTEYRYFKGYNYKLTEALVLNDLLALDTELEAIYDLVQSFNSAIRTRNYEKLKMLINQDDQIGFKPLKTVIKTFKKQQEYLLNAIRYSYSNGRIEGINNLIKVIKRIAFGYRKFENFRTRILLISNTVIRLST